MGIFSLAARKCRAYADFIRIYYPFPANRIAQLVLIIFSALFKFYYNLNARLAIKKATTSCNSINSHVSARRKRNVHIFQSNNSTVL